MNKRASGLRRSILIWAILALLAGIVAAAMTAAAGPLYRHGAAPLPAAFGLLEKGFWVGIAAAAAGLVGGVAALLGRRFVVAVLPLVGLGLGLGTSLWLHGLYRDAKTAPPIHDITTNPSNPPEFKALAPERRDVEHGNGVAYGGGGKHMEAAETHALQKFFSSPAGKASPGRDAAAKACTQWGPGCLSVVQRAYYPKLQPLQAPGVAPDKGYAAALATARSMGWKIAAADPKARHIEATATTAWFGFKDDVAINVTAAGRGSVINIRSESRIGLSDLGKNARRVHHYLHRLAHRLNAGGQDGGQG